MFQEAASLVEAESSQYLAIEPELLRHLDPHQRMVFAQLAYRLEWMTTTDLRSLLGLSDRTIRDRLKQWIGQGFLTPRDEHSERVRSITLSADYQDLAKAVREEPDRYRYLLR